MKTIKVRYDDFFGEYKYIDSNLNLTLSIGDKVIVDDNNLKRMATVTDFCDNDSFDSVKILRVVTNKDIKQFDNNINDSSEVLLYTQNKADSLELDMKVVSAFYTFDRKQLFISYVSNNRVDFRELAKILAQKYKTRIELRQIGVRDRAKKIGGLGPCGLFLCCSSFLTEFASVSINMAKNQFLALNPTKINGLCGRLLCCLNYEDEVYTELKKGLPNIGNLVETESGLGKVVEVDVFRKKYKVEIKNKGIVEISLNA